MNQQENISRRDLFRRAIRGVTAVGATAVLGALVPAGASAAEQSKNPEGNIPWGKGKYQTFPRILDEQGQEGVILQHIDLGTLGPDVDTIFGIDFLGDIPTGSTPVFMPDGPVSETRVVGIKRTSIETIQFQGALGGDRFDVIQVKNDETLGAVAELHAKNTARKHQKVIFVGDFGDWQDQWGENEVPFLTQVVRAQRPAKPNIGIPAPDFVNPREFGQ